MDFKEIIFVSGKGGTGKTTLALLTAQRLSRGGKSVLFVELADRSSAQPLLATSHGPRYQPTASGFSFDWCLVQGMDCLVEYVGSFTKIERVTQKFFENSFIQSLVKVAPGLNDLSVLGKLTSHIRGHGPSFKYDHIVIDAHGTGSFASLLQAPGLLAKSVSRGPLKVQSESIDQVLRDKRYVQYFFASLYEELAMDELEETLKDFSTDFKDQVHVIMNKRWGFDEDSVDSGPWGHFVQQKRSKEERLKRRALELHPHCWSVDLMTDPLSVSMQQEGELLRPI